MDKARPDREVKGYPPPIGEEVNIYTARPPGD
jgi:hypothetical protein